MDQAPVPYTCSTIDSGLTNITDIRSELSSIDESDITEVVGNCNYQLDLLVDVLEEIRSSNQKLREWGNELYEKAESLEQKVDKLNLKLDQA